MFLSAKMLRLSPCLGDVIKPRTVKMALTKKIATTQRVCNGTIFWRVLINPDSNHSVRSRIWQRRGALILLLIKKLLDIEIMKDK